MGGWFAIATVGIRRKITDMRLRRFLFLIALVLFLHIGNGAFAAGSETVWSGLVMATNVPQPEAIPGELVRLQDTLKEVFGYNQFKVIGQSQKSVRTGEEDWLASSKYFALHVDGKGATSAGYQLNLQLFKEKQLLLETEAKLSRSAPLVIRGPQIGDGQLLLVLVVQ